MLWLALMPLVGKIRWAALNFAGSWHDAALTDQLAIKVLDPVRTPAPYGILCDTAFCRSGALKDRMMTPLTEPQRRNLTVLPCSEAVSS
jgi:hypothetical protein